MADSPGPPSTSSVGSDKAEPDFPTDGFWLTTPRGITAHVTGDRNMSEESAQALSQLIEAAYDRLKEKK